MKLGMLVALQSSGALKVNKESTQDNIILGNTQINREQCLDLISKLGWIECSKTPIEIIEKTNKFINGIKPAINKGIILEQTEVTFQNRRKTNSTSCVDRTKLVCNGKFDITVLSGMEGLGGRYGVYSSTNNFVKPVYSCSSLKLLGEWINKLVVEKSL